MTNNLNKTIERSERPPDNPAFRHNGPSTNSSNTDSNREGILTLLPNVDALTTIHEGVVVRKYVGTYHVDVDGQIVICSISNRLRKHLIFPTADPTSIPRHGVMDVQDIKTVDPVAIGDCVRFVGAGNGQGMITDVLARRSALSRPAPGPKPLEQVLVANLDQVIAVFAAARPEPKWNLLDRYLVSAESSELEPIIIITKMDLADEEAIDAEMDVYRAMGYTVLLTSAESGRGIDELKALLEDKVSVLVGKSGVGKTSLLNALQPGLGARVGKVSEGDKGKGKHTTTNLEMIALDSGGSIVDTPGIRVFGLWEVDGSDISALFRDFRPYADDCQFGADCWHEHEPGCAVVAAVGEGFIHQRRYESYLRLLNGKGE